MPSPTPSNRSSRRDGDGEDRAPSAGWTARPVVTRVARLEPILLRPSEIPTHCIELYATPMMLLRRGGDPAAGWGRFKGALTPT